MQKPALVIMAAGMGSRYGGLKQIDPVGPDGEIIMDYSIYDALKAGFSKIVFIIRKENEEAFRDKIGRKAERLVDTEYIFQSLEDLPVGFQLPHDRKMPWGTGHAVMSCRNSLTVPFAVINADDFYGASTFQILFDNLKTAEDQDGIYQYSMAGFQLENTLTEHGHVARGICTVDGNDCLSGIQERTRIQRFDDGTKYTEDGVNWVTIPEGSTVSMNTWGFTPGLFVELEARFPLFLQANRDQLVKAEYFLPSVVDSLISEGKALVKVLKSREHWYGVTYQEDKPVIRQAILNLVKQGAYPDKLWRDMT